MREITYEFEELEIMPEHAVYATGWAIISYEIEPADRDVGYRGGVCYSIESIAIATNKDHTVGTELAHDSYLYGQIETALNSSKYDWRIEEECAERENALQDDDY